MIQTTPLLGANGGPVFVPGTCGTCPSAFSLSTGSSRPSSTSQPRIWVCGRDKNEVFCIKIYVISYSQACYRLRGVRAFAPGGCAAKMNLHRTFWLAGSTLEGAQQPHGSRGRADRSVAGPVSGPLPSIPFITHLRAPSPDLILFFSVSFATQRQIIKCPGFSGPRRPSPD